MSGCLLDGFVKDEPVLCWKYSVLKILPLKYSESLNRLLIPKIFSSFLK